MVRGLMAKLRVLSDEQCMNLVKDIQKNYHLPYPRTITTRRFCVFVGRDDTGTAGLPASVESQVT